MTYRIIATIDVGSYELELKIFEISRKKGIVILNHVRHVIPIPLGKSSFPISMNYVISYTTLLP